MPKNTAAVTALGGGPAEEEDWKAKYERSEGARQHLRKQLVSNLFYNPTAAAVLRERSEILRQ